MTYRFQLVPIAASGPLTFTCIKCNTRISQANGEVWADLNGPAFQAYYCAPCVHTTMHKAEQPTV